MPVADKNTNSQLEPCHTSIIPATTGEASVQASMAKYSGKRMVASQPKRRPEAREFAMTLYNLGNPPKKGATGWLRNWHWDAELFTCRSLVLDQLSVTGSYHPLEISHGGLPTACQPGVSPAQNPVFFFQ